MSLLLYKTLYFFKKIEYLLSMQVDKLIIRFVLRNSKPKIIDRKQIKSILLMRNDGIGDMVITTPLIRILSQHGYEVSVMSQKSALDIIQNNPYVKQAFVWNDHLSGKARQTLEQNIRDLEFDLLIDMRYPIYFKHKPHKTIQSYYFHAKYNMGWNKSAFPYFDASIAHYTRRGHSITLIQKFLEVLNIQADNLRYELFPSPQSITTAQTFIASCRQNNPNAPIIILNPYTGHHRRDMRFEQIAALVKHITEQYPQGKIIAIGLKNRIQSLIELLQNPQVVYYESANIMDVAPLIEAADLVISPDTSIVHMVAAYQKPLVALYASGRRTPQAISTAKNRVKENYHEVVDEARARFFDAPRIQQGLRPKGKMLLVEGAFGPNNPHAIQLKNYTHQICEITPIEIYQAAQTLLSQQGFKPKTSL